MGVIFQREINGITRKTLIDNSDIVVKQNKQLKRNVGFKIRVDEYVHGYIMHSLGVKYAVGLGSDDMTLVFEERPLEKYEVYGFYFRDNGLVTILCEKQQQNEIEF